MKPSRSLTRVLLPAILVLVGSTWAQRAHAATIDMFTGSWRVETYEDVAIRDLQSINGLQGWLGSGFHLLFSFDGQIADYQQEGCPPEGTWPCLMLWSGSLTGGTVFFAAYANVVDYTFTGAITGGVFSGVLFCEDGCVWQNDATMSFSSTWANGWASAGTLAVSSSNGWSSGTLSMTTTSFVPEPGSFALLSASLAAFASLRSRRRKGAAGLRQDARG
jgi:hypothetical protein